MSSEEEERGSTVNLREAYTLSTCPMHALASTNRASTPWIWPESVYRVTAFPEPTIGVSRHSLSHKSFESTFGSCLPVGIAYFCNPEAKTSESHASSSAVGDDTLRMAVILPCSPTARTGCPLRLYLTWRQPDSLFLSMDRITQKAWRCQLLQSCFYTRRHGSNPRRPRPAHS